MHSLGYVDLTQLVIFESEEFESSKIRLTDVPEGFVAVAALRLRVGCSFPGCLLVCHLPQSVRL